MQVTSGSDYGSIIRQARLAKGWARIDLAQVYGRFFHDEIISEDTVRMWEDYNKVPKKMKRRQILALLLDIPIVALGLEPFTSLALPENSTQNKGIDLATATEKLQQYKQQNHATTVKPLLAELLGTIHTIHNEMPYVNQGKRTQFMLLLSDYQQFVASIFRDHSQYEQALYYQNKAYIIAKTLQTPEQIALALWRRGLTYHEQGNFQAGIADLQTAQSLRPTSVHLQGVLWSSLGHVQSHAATTRSEQQTALAALNQAERFLDRINDEPDIYFIKFNEEGYHLNRASAWLGAPVKLLRSSPHAFDALSLVPADETRKRRYAYSTYLQARGWFEEGELPMAAQVGMDALAVAIEINSQVNIKRIEAIYQDLKSTTYGNSPDVAELGVRLLRANNPALFT